MLLIRGGCIVSGGSAAVGDVAADRGVILARGTIPPSLFGGDTEVIDATDCFVLPGFIDIHTHGAAGCDFSTCGPGQIADALKFYAGQGVTSLLAAIMPADEDVMARQLGIVAQAQADGAGQIAGIHLEGPFLSTDYKGAMPKDKLRAPDWELFCRLQTAARGLIKMITIAPELDGAAEFTEKAARLGCRVSLGHSGASYDEAARCIAHGARNVTHVMNAMKPMHQRDPGVLTAALNEDIFCEAICDGVHLHPQIVRMLYKIKGARLINAVTDSIMAAGLDDGEYNLGGRDVTVRGGKATLSGTDTLAGSTLTPGAALLNIMEFTGMPVELASLSMTLNPAKALGLGDKGELAPGKSADIVVLDRAFHVKRVYMAGQALHDADDV